MRNVGVTEALVQFFPEWTRELFATVTVLGDWLVILVALGVVSLFDVVTSLRRGDDQLWADRTAFVVAVVFGGLAFALLLKTLFAAPRPPAELHAVTPGEGGFPSGHTMVATVGWGALGWWLVDESRRLSVAVVAVVVALVGLSRLALGVHFLMDVLASVVFAVGYLAVIARTTAERPRYAFAFAFVLALLAALASGGETRAILALIGTAAVAFVFLRWNFYPFVVFLVPAAVVAALAARLEGT